MAKKSKMDIPKEVGKIWQEAKVNLKALGQKTLKLAQKGEVELVRASKVGKLQLDIVSINLKKENSFRQVGKKAYEMHAKGGIKADRIQSLFNQIDKLNQQIRSRKAKIATLKKE